MGDPIEYEPEKEYRKRPYAEAFFPIRPIRPLPDGYVDLFARVAWDDHRLKKAGHRAADYWLGHASYRRKLQLYSVLFLALGALLLISDFIDSRDLSAFPGPLYWFGVVIFLASLIPAYLVPSLSRRCQTYRLTHELLKSIDAAELAAQADERVITSEEDRGFHPDEGSPASEGAQPSRRAKNEIMAAREEAQRFRRFLVQGTDAAAARFYKLCKGLYGRVGGLKTLEKDMGTSGAEAIERFQLVASVGTVDDLREARDGLVQVLLKISAGDWTWTFALSR